jgi:hypothetical protein
MWNIVTALSTYPLVLVAHDLKLFSRLAAGPRSRDELARDLRLQDRPVRALLSVCTSLGLVRIDDDRYTLTPTAEEYLLDRSPLYMGSFLDALIANFNHVYMFERMRLAVTTDTPQVYRGEGLFESHEQQAALAAAFTRAMHGHSMAAALAWPHQTDLTGVRHLLDMGGGSGAHAIAAALRWPTLRATVLDLPPVCDVARQYIADFGVASRVDAVVGDLFEGELPDADVHFYADIFHDWPAERGEQMLRRSFAALPSGGRVLIHEMVADEDGGPLAVAGYSAAMLVWTQGRQYSRAEFARMLTMTGFVDIAITSTFGYWTVVSARKP